MRLHFIGALFCLILGSSCRFDSLIISGDIPFDRDPLMHDPNLADPVTGPGLPDDGGVGNLDSPCARTGKDNPHKAPIGGGTGYPDIKTTGDMIVSNETQLRSALASANSGDVVYIDENAAIKLQGNPQFIVPAGVEVRGNRGFNCSAGPLLYIPDFASTPENSAIFVLDGPGAVVSGLRLVGPLVDINDAPDDVVKPDHFAIQISAENTVVSNNYFSHWTREAVRYVKHDNGVDNINTAPRISYNTIAYIPRFGIFSGSDSGSLIIEGNYSEWTHNAYVGLAKSGSRVIIRDNYFVKVPTRPDVLANFFPASGIHHFAIDSNSQSAFDIHNNTFAARENTVNDPVYDDNYGFGLRDLRLNGSFSGPSEISKNCFVNTTHDFAVTLNSGPSNLTLDESQNFYGMNVFPAHVQSDLDRIFKLEDGISQAHIILFPPFSHMGCSRKIESNSHLNFRYAGTTSSVRIFIDDQMIYNSSQLPGLNSVLVKPCDLTDKVHQAKIEIIGNNNVEMEKVFSFESKCI